MTRQLGVRANAGDRFDLDRILPDQTERPFRLQTALRVVVDDLRVLEMRTAMNEGMRLHGTALELAAHWSGS
jgi:hypothetical protein